MRRKQAALIAMHYREKRMDDRVREIWEMRSEKKLANYFIIRHDKAAVDGLMEALRYRCALKSMAVGIEESSAHFRNNPIKSIKSSRRLEASKEEVVSIMFRQGIFAFVVSTLLLSLKMARTEQNSLREISCTYSSGAISIVVFSGQRPSATEQGANK